VLRKRRTKKKNEEEEERGGGRGEGGLAPGQSQSFVEVKNN
jgi:hypothetical protein